MKQVGTNGPGRPQNERTPEAAAVSLD